MIRLSNCVDLNLIKNTNIVIKDILFYHNEHLISNSIKQKFSEQYKDFYDEGKHIIYGTIDKRYYVMKLRDHYVEPINHLTKLHELNVIFAIIKIYQIYDAKYNKFLSYYNDIIGLIIVNSYITIPYVRPFYKKDNPSYFKYIVGQNNNYNTKSNKNIIDCDHTYINMQIKNYITSIILKDHILPKDLIIVCISYLRYSFYDLASTNNYVDQELIYHIPYD